jgi:HAD superfamily phosphatase
LSFQAVIFDIDNVLIDTRASYTDCIRKTVEVYLETIFRFKPSRTSLLSRQDVERFKSLGGFNDDWDTCYGLLLYLLSLKPARRTLNELAKKKNIVRFANTVKSLPLGVKGVEKLLGCQPAVLMKTVEEIFQRLYLSEYMWNEKLLLPKPILGRVKRSGLAIGILTGRTGEEAKFALRRFQLDRLIDCVVTQDETPRKLRKPNPHGLFKIASKLGRKLQYLYVGDLPDDVLAVKRARKKMKIASCGYLAAASSRREMKRQLKKAGAHFTCERPRELADIILK